MLELSAEITVDRPAALVWATVADYGCDPQWRAGVTTMAPTPSGPVRPGTTTAEVIRVGGRTYRNGGVVTAVEPGARFTWTTTSGAVADGARAVRAVSAERCRVRIDQRIHPRGAQRLMTPLLRVLLSRTLAADARRLKALVESRSPTGVRGR
jgi:uncharacterized membrane protein